MNHDDMNAVRIGKRLCIYMCKNAGMCNLEVRKTTKKIAHFKVIIANLFLRAKSGNGPGQRFQRPIFKTSSQFSTRFSNESVDLNACSL